MEKERWSPIRQFPVIGRERWKEAANSMGKHLHEHWMLGWAGIIWLRQHETSSTYLGFGIHFTGSWNSGERKKKSARRGTRKRGVGNEAHSPLVTGSNFFVRKVVHFPGPDPLCMLRCEVGLGSEFSLPTCFYECAGCSADSVRKHFR